MVKSELNSQIYGNILIYQSNRYYDDIVEAVVN